MGPDCETADQPCNVAGSDDLLDLMIPVSDSTPGAVFVDQAPRNVASLVLRPGFGPVLGPGMAAPLGPRNRLWVCCS